MFIPLYLELNLRIHIDSLSSRMNVSGYRFDGVGSEKDVIFDVFPQRLVLEGVVDHPVAQDEDFRQLVGIEPSGDVGVDPRVRLVDGGCRHQIIWRGRGGGG